MSVRPRVEWKIGQSERDHVEPLLTRWLWVLPSWVELVKVEYSPAESTEHASSMVLVEYRDYRLRIGRTWFAESEDERERTLVHELVHAALGPMVDVVWRIKDTLLEDRERAFVNRTWTEAFETSVTDLSDSLFRMVRETAAK